MRRRIGSPLYVRASSTHSAMATRAGVAECSTSDMAQRSSARSIRASPVTGYCGARRVISASIESRCAISAATSSRARVAAFGIALFLGEMALQDGVGGPLPEVRLEDGGERQPATGPPAADAVSSRRHRPARSPTRARDRAVVRRSRPPSRGPGPRVARVAVPGGRRATAGPALARRGSGSRPAGRRTSRRHAGPPRPTRTTPGTSSAASRTSSAMTPRPTVSSGPLTTASRSRRR